MEQSFSRMSMFQRLASRSSSSTTKCPCARARRPATGRLRWRRTSCSGASGPSSAMTKWSGARLEQRRRDGPVRMRNECLHSDKSWMNTVLSPQRKTQWRKPS